MKINIKSIIANWSIFDILTEFGNQRGYTAAQVALAWLLAQKPWIVPIPGTTNLEHLKENLASADLQLTPVDLHNIESAISKITIQGDRYNVQEQKRVEKLK